MIDVRQHPLATYWHDAYITAARNAYPDVCGDHDLAVGWKLTGRTGVTTGGYYWPLVNGDHDCPVLHEATAWTAHGDSCPRREGDGLCLITTPEGFQHCTSGTVTWVTDGVLRVLVYPTRLARGNTAGKMRTPWVIDVDCGDPIELIRVGLVPYLSGANLFGANLFGADLSGAYLFGADLSGANLSVANLSRADLSRAYLSGANLDRADLSRADLFGANLFGADLSGADLFGANLDRANLDRAAADRYTRWPSGFQVPSTVVRT